MPNANSSGTFQLTISTSGATPAGTPTFTVSAANGTCGSASDHADGSGTLTVGKANATVVVAPYTATHDGNPHTATVTSITGVNGETGATVGAVTLNTTHTAAGTYASDSWSFTGAANYNDIASTTITDTITPVVVTPTLVSNSNPASLYGAPVEFTLQNFGPATFTDTFKNVTKTISGCVSVTLCKTSSLSVGTHLIKAGGLTITQEVAPSAVILLQSAMHSMDDDDRKPNDRKTPLPTNIADIKVFDKGAL